MDIASNTTFSYLDFTCTTRTDFIVITRASVNCLRFHFAFFTWLVTVLPTNQPNSLSFFLCPQIFQFFFDVWNLTDGLGIYSTGLYSRRLRRADNVKKGRGRSNLTERSEGLEYH